MRPDGVVPLFLVPSGQGWLLGAGRCLGPDREWPLAVPGPRLDPYERQSPDAA
ncbi:MAG: hypothetical protein R3B82_27620 [Sandaracinaceae bacterium]